MTDDNRELYERVARIEERIEAHAAHDDRRFEETAEILEKLDKIEAEFSRYRGVVGGILIAVTALVSFVKMFGASIKAWFLAGT